MIYLKQTELFKLEILVIFTVFLKREPYVKSIFECLYSVNQTELCEQACIPTTFYQYKNGPSLCWTGEKYCF